MIYLNIQNLSYTWINPLGLIMFVFLSGMSAKAQGDKAEKSKGFTEKSGIVFDFTEASEEDEINVLKTFLHSNTKAFLITIYGFKEEKVQVFIYSSKTNDQLHLLDVEPQEEICNVKLLAEPLSKGTYHVAVKGESRVVSKKMIID